MNLYAALIRHWPDDGDACAIEAHGTGRSPARYTWNDLERGSAMIANLFARLGLPRDGRVLAAVDKSVEALMLHLACSRAGLVYVPLDPADAPTRIDSIVDRVRPAVAVCTPLGLGRIARSSFARGVRAVYTLGEERTGSLLERASHCPTTFDTVDRGDDDVAAVLCGTDVNRLDEAVAFTHGRLASEARAFGAVSDARIEGEEDRRDTSSRTRSFSTVLHALPLFDAYGLFVACDGALLAGASQTFLTTFDAARVLELLPHAARLFGAPTFYERLSREPALDRAICANVREFISSAAPLPVTIAAQWRARTGRCIVDRCGAAASSPLKRPDRG